MGYYIERVMNNSNNKNRVSILPASISLVDEYGRVRVAKNEISRALFAQLLIDFCPLIADADVTHQGSRRVA